MVNPAAKANRIRDSQGSNISFVIAAQPTLMITVIAATAMYGQSKKEIGASGIGLQLYRSRQVQSNLEAY